MYYYSIINQKNTDITWKLFFAKVRIKKHIAKSCQITFFQQLESGFGDDIFLICLIRNILFIILIFKFLF